MGKNRVIKPSGRLFGELAKANGIVSETVSKFKPDWNQS
jgi:hypothetical protein